MKANKIHIVSSNNLLGTLLAQPLGDTLAVSCLHVPHFDVIPQNESQAGFYQLILFDWTSQELPNSLSQLESLARKENQAVAIFNAPHNGEIEAEALKRGFRGIFFQSDSLESLVKGTRALLSGDLWFSRKVMESCLKEQPSVTPEPDMASHNLTDREKEILLRIASGLGNKEIAEEMRISQHTVKTHVYNIFKKIDVNGRLQAALWVIKNL